MLSHALSLLEIAIVKDSYECESLKVRLGILQITSPGILDM